MENSNDFWRGQYETLADYITRGKTAQAQAQIKALRRCLPHLSFNRTTARRRRAARRTAQAEQPTA